MPDDNHPGGQAYDHLRGNKYVPKDNSVVLSRSVPELTLFNLSDKTYRTSKIGNNTLLGPSTQVREEAHVIASTLGARCSIGTATVLRNAYLFDDVTIGPNCVLESCIIGAGVQVGEGSRIARGSLVADGVKLGPGTVLKPFDRVSRQRQKSNLTTNEDESDEGDDDSELEEAEQSTYSAPCMPPAPNVYLAALICRPTLSLAESGCWLGGLRVAPESRSKE